MANGLGSLRGKKNPSKFMKAHSKCNKCNSYTAELPPLKLMLYYYGKHHLILI